uniref:C2orf72-like C-terminal domain-containing protein n=1 Tax=Catharus ustulatus TaxID=91951 RepID=A0A8C3U8V2_CATUS
PTLQPPQPLFIPLSPSEPLHSLRALVERVGGRRAVLLVAEVAEGAPTAPALAAFARDLLGDEAPRAPCPAPVPVPGCRARRAAGGRRRALGARLLLVLCGGGAARGRGARTRLREVVRDVRGRLPAGPPPAVVGVLLPGGDGEDAAVLDAALRRHFPVPGTVQAARYSPGSPGDCRAAACRALRAALQHPAGTRVGGLLHPSLPPSPGGRFLQWDLLRFPVGSSPSQWDLPHPNGF